MTISGVKFSGVNALTVDVEDYFQVSALEPHFPRDQWDAVACRVEQNTQRLLDLLQQHEAKATFFTLGWVAQRYPGLLVRMVSEGHEVASHGYGHQRASELDRASLRQDLLRAKGVIEDATGVAVRGYRAPSFSIGKSNLWAFDVLAATGHSYSSSVYPVKHDHYGMPDAPRRPYEPVPGLIEVPITTLRSWGRNMPAGGGGYFRLLPYDVSAWLLRRVNAVEMTPAVFYLHPWELDPAQPRVSGAKLKTRFRHYLNLARTEARLTRLVTEFRWDRMDKVFGV